MKVKNQYLPLVGSLFTNFIFQGIAAIVISQNMTIFQERWDASVSEVMSVASAIGVGRILSLSLSGVISDKIGRKVAVMCGIVSYVFFYLSLLVVTDYRMAFVVAISAGFGNAFLDTSTYPTVAEAVAKEKSSSALSVFNKAFISVGQFLFPIATSWGLEQGFYFGWTFLLSASCLVINALIISRMSFPLKKDVVTFSPTKEPKSPKRLGSRFAYEGIALLIFSFVSVSLFTIFTLWIPRFAEYTIGVTEDDGRLFVSLYSFFSFVSVFGTSYLLTKGINIPKFMIICVSVTTASLGYMLLAPSYLSLVIASAIVGLAAAGGIWQIGLSTLLEFFPYRKGTVTSYYSLSTSVSVALTPYLTGVMAEHNLYDIFAYNIFLGLIGLVALVVVNHRYHKVIIK